MDILRVVGENVRRRRKELKLSQGAVADRAGLHKNTVWNLENGRLEGMQTETLEALASALDTPAWKLLLAPAGSQPVPELLLRYRDSPWYLIDKPTEEEMIELISHDVARWLGAKADEEAVHHAILAQRKRGGGGA